MLARQKGVAHLYIRAAGLKPGLLRGLRKRDPLTFTYVLVKTGKSLTPKQALAIFEECKFDDRIGLFIWCLGQMQLWSVLEKIAARTESLMTEQMRYMRRKYSLKGTLELAPIGQPLG